MICARHDWWDAEPCPRCAVTAAEMPHAPRVDELPDIPDFLKRNPDGTFAHPELMLHEAPAGGRPRHVVVIPTGQLGPDGPHHTWSDLELYAALDDTELTLVERQPIYQELRAREDKKKSLQRIAEMKAKKATKDAESK